MTRKPFIMSAMVLILIVVPLCAVMAQNEGNNTNADVCTGQKIWEEYQSNPGRHPNIPNCSYAGYRSGEAPLPELPVKANVRDYGAIPNDEGDDTAAFNAAIKAAAKAGGGAVLAPAGRYVFSGIIRLNHNGVVLRGEGIGQTVLDFCRPLTNILDVTAFTGFAGGLIWVGPDDIFNPNGSLKTFPRGWWEIWRTGPLLARLTAVASRGDSTVVVDDTTRLKPGDLVLALWDSPSDASLLRHIYGHAPTAGKIPGKLVGNCRMMMAAPGQPGNDADDGSNTNGFNLRWDQGISHFMWPVAMAAITNNRVTLAQPLRLDARAEWKVRFCAMGAVVRDTGVEHLSITLHLPSTHNHLKGGGWNAIYLNAVYDCWVRDVEITDAENGVILAAAKRVTVVGVRLKGASDQHHSLACRVLSHDNLFTDFRVEGPRRVMHGVNVEGFSSGNVWSHGFQERGTFDSHCGLPFDNLYTDCTVANDPGSWCGGSESAGPRMGRRVVRWNVRVGVEGRKDARSVIVNQPKLLPMGALVGVQGVPVSFAEVNAYPAEAAMPLGDKDCIIGDPGIVPYPTNLYEAQLQLRLGR